MGRPIKTFHELVGQQRLVSLVRDLCRGARRDGRAIPPLLLVGPAGSGKACLARAISRETGGQLRAMLGAPDLTRVHLVDELAETRPNDVVMIEDIHRLSGAVLALLAEAIGHGEIPSSDGPKLDRSRPIPLPDRLTIIGTTDAPGRLPPSLGTRFLALSLAPYRTAELKAIVMGIARQQERDVTPQAARALAEAAEGSPRLASVLLDTIALAAGQSRVTEAVVRAELERAGLDKFGFWPRHRTYLHALCDADDAGLGLEALSIRTGFDAAYIRRDIEPLLFAKGLIQIRGSSRWLSEEGATHARAIAAREARSTLDGAFPDDTTRSNESASSDAAERDSEVPLASSI